MIYFTIVIYVMAAIAIGRLLTEADGSPTSKADWVAFFALLTLWPLAISLGVILMAFRSIRDKYQEYKYWSVRGDKQAFELRDQLFRLQNQLDLEKTESAHWRRESKKYEESYLKLLKRRAKKKAEALKTEVAEKLDKMDL